MHHEGHISHAHRTERAEEITVSNVIWMVQQMQEKGLRKQASLSPLDLRFPRKTPINTTYSRTDQTETVCDSFYMYCIFTR